jgi:hypothetical protein
MQIAYDRYQTIAKIAQKLEIPAPGPPDGQSLAFELLCGSRQGI